MAGSSAQCMLQSLVQLTDNELYEDAACLGSVLMSQLEAHGDCLQPADRVQSHQYYARSLYEVAEYRKAEEYYYSALRMLKEKSAGGRSSGGRRNASAARCDPVEIEMRYQLSRCLERQGKLVEAVGVLDPVPAKLRPPKASAALARLYTKGDFGGRPARTDENATVAPAKGGGGTGGGALDCYEAVVRQMPLCLNAMRRYLQLGGAQATAAELAHDALRNANAGEAAAPDWLDDWLGAHACLSRHGQQGRAVALLRRLGTAGPLANNEHVLRPLAAAYAQCGEPAKALLVLQRWRTADAHSLSPVPPLAAALAKEQRTKELEQLAAWARRTAPDRVETWIALAHLSRAQGRPAEALFFASKATFDEGDRPRGDALLLKARVLMDDKRYPQAMQHIREALSASRRGAADIETYETLVDCYLAQGRTDEATAAATMCFDALGRRAPRALLLYARVLSKDKAKLGRAKQTLESAVKSAPHLLAAVHLLVELYDKAGEYDKAISLLRAQTSVHVNSNLHQMLGDLLSKANRAVEAVDCYKHAAILDPTCANKHAASLTASLSAGDECHSVVAAHVRPTAADVSLDEAPAGNDSSTGGEADASGDAAVATAASTAPLATPPDAAGTSGSGGAPPVNHAPLRRTRVQRVPRFHVSAAAAHTPAAGDDAARMDTTPPQSDGPPSGRLFDRRSESRDADEFVNGDAHGV